jgi:hypothetical protein
MKCSLKAVFCTVSGVGAGAGPTSVVCAAQSRHLCVAAFTGSLVMQVVAALLLARRASGQCASGCTTAVVLQPLHGMYAVSCVQLV